jgi:hypothetical protein
VDSYRKKSKKLSLRHDIVPRLTRFITGLDGPARMRPVIAFTLVLASLMTSVVASAQSTISDRPFELLAGNGMWVSALPDYELGTTTGGSPAIRDSLDDVGYYGDIKAIRRFLGTRTSFEARGFYAYSGSQSSSQAGDINVLGPLGGSSQLTGSAASLDSDTNHYGFDVGLRDTWRTRFGGLSGGLLFSYMAFDQTFDVDYGSMRLLREELNSDYVGGKGVLGWDGLIYGRPSTLDVAVGFYQLTADYRFVGNAISGSYQDEFEKTPLTIETIFSRYHSLRGCQVGLTMAATYIAQMPSIHRELGQAVVIDNDDAFLFRLMFEILL